MAAASNQVDWAELWKHGGDADLTLELTVTGNPHSTQQRRVHKILLKAKSEYFKSRLSQQYELKGHGPTQVSTALTGSGHLAVVTKKAKAGRAKKLQKVAQPEAVEQPPLIQPVTNGPSLTLTVACESVEDQAACMAALKHAYAGELPAGDDAALLAQVCRKADYLGMSDTVGACLDALNKVAELPEHNTEVSRQLPAVRNILPEQMLAGSDSGKALLQQLRTIATSKYTNAVDIVRDAQLQQQFVSPPFDLLLHWASLDELKPDSENTIAVLMHVWVVHNRGARWKLPGRRNEQLSKLLRVRQLSFPFHLHALPKLPWYQPSSSPPTEHALMRWGQERINCAPLDKAALDAFGWASARNVMSDGVTIHWALSTTELQSKWGSTQKHVMTGPKAYYAGYTCSLGAELEHEGHHKRLALYVHCCYCPELSPLCEGPSYAACNVIVEAGQGE